MSKFTKDHWIAISGLVVGTVIAVLVPIWQIYWVETPRLSVEIVSIERKLEDGEHLTRTNYSTLFKLLEDLMPSERFDLDSLKQLGISDSAIYGGSIKRSRLTPDDVKKLIDYTADTLESYPKRMDILAKSVETLEEIQPTKLTLRRIREISLSYYYTDLDREKFEVESNRENKTEQYFIGVKNEILAELKAEQEKMLERQSDLDSGLSQIRSELARITEELDKKSSRYYVTGTVTNSGNASVSLKRPGLLRVYIGSGNYVDLKLEIIDREYKDVAQIGERASKLITFKSRKLLELPSEDRKLIHQYWGKNVNGVLFTIDSLSNVHASNLTPFSDALYQKQIYDRLIFEASKIN